MQAALIVNPVGLDRDANLAAIQALCSEAAAQGASLLLLPEAALTGLLNTDDPARDLPLGTALHGPVVGRLASFCQMNGCWLAVGLLERCGNSLYDTVALLGPFGCIRLVYRRIHPGWHGPEADPTVYRQGQSIAMADTPFGKVGILICGDLFDDLIIQQVKTASLDLLLLPFARCFDDGSWDQTRWDAEELPTYAERVACIRVPTLMVNYLALLELPDGGSFGGAFHVSASGDILGSLPLGRSGILLVDLGCPA